MLRLLRIVSGTWVSLLPCCLLFLAYPQNISASKMPQPPKRDYHVPYEDSSSGRMYVSMDSGIMVKEDSLISRLRQFLEERKRDMWGDKFTKVALFSDLRYARPRESMQKGEIKAWADRFLAEFDSRKNVVWLFPAVPTKRKKIQLAMREGAKGDRPGRPVP